MGKVMTLENVMDLCDIVVRQVHVCDTVLYITQMTDVGNCVVYRY